MKLLIEFLIAGFFMVQTASANELQLGQLAPDFSLTDQHNQLHTLSKMRGQWVILYFYPRDETPGCIAEACSFRDNIVALQSSKAVVWGLSVDSNESHAEFATKHQLPFTLLADKGGKVAKEYDALLDLFVFKVAKRHSFIIDPEGRVVKIYRKVDPKTHVAEILKDLQALQSRQ